MNRNDFYDILAEFFRGEFETDPVAIGDWLAQGGTDVDQFIAELDFWHPKKG